MSDLRLSDLELYDITGYKRAKDQAAYVRAQYGIPAHVNAENRAIVIRAHLEAAREPARAAGVRTVRKAA